MSRRTNIRPVLLAAALAAVAGGVGGSVSYSVQDERCSESSVSISGQCVEMDDRAALQLAFDSVPDGAWPTAIDLIAGATYEIDEPLVLRRPVHIRGNGARIRPAAGVTAFHILQAADASIVENLNIQGYRGSCETCTDPGGGAFRGYDVSPILNVPAGDNILMSWQDDPWWRWQVVGVEPNREWVLSRRTSPPVVMAGPFTEP